MPKTTTTSTTIATKAPVNFIMRVSSQREFINQFDDRELTIHAIFSFEEAFPLGKRLQHKFCVTRKLSYVM